MVAGMSEQVFIHGPSALVAARVSATPRRAEDPERIAQAVGAIFDDGLWPWG